jgi:hypothetical protein
MLGRPVPRSPLVAIRCREANDMVRAYPPTACLGRNLLDGDHLLERTPRSRQTRPAVAADGKHRA